MMVVRETLAASRPTAKRPSGSTSLVEKRDIVARRLEELKPQLEGARSAAKAATDARRKLYVQDTIEPSAIDHVDRVGHQASASAAGLESAVGEITARRELNKGSRRRAQARRATRRESTTRSRRVGRFNACSR
jgi:hypothetical protein